MNKTIWGVIAVGVILLGGGGYLLAQKSQPVTQVAPPVIVEQTDAQKFAALYPGVSEDNVFVFRDGQEIINILKNGTGTVFLGFDDCGWCQAYVPIMNTLAKETGIEKIYYYNIQEDRANDSAIYQEIVAILGDNLDFDDEGRPRIFVPDVTFVKEGQIVGHNNDTSMNTTAENGPPEEYWTPELTAELRLKLREGMLQVLPEDCGSSCDL